jgi:DNA-binding MarR family transcriptional regulator
VEDHERRALAASIVVASRALLAVAVRTVGSGPVEITVGQHRVLTLLAEHTTLSVSAMAEHLGVDQSNASRHCARLQKLGLVSRRRAERDGRAIDVALTAAGRRQLNAIRDAWRHEVADILKRMTDRQARAVTRALQHFDAAAAEQHAALVPPSAASPLNREPS